jgi:hypothetical protein
MSLYFHPIKIAAIICAKWSMDLGFSQFRQLLWAIAGFVAAPLILLICMTSPVSCPRGPKGFGRRSAKNHYRTVAAE